ncbi:hypothetical protein WBG83_09265 [Paenibacillus sp. y28]
MNALLMAPAVLGATTKRQAAQGAMRVAGRLCSQRDIRPRECLWNGWGAGHGAGMV